jgi:hypothetical protein
MKSGANSNRGQIMLRIKFGTFLEAVAVTRVKTL